MTIQKIKSGRVVDLIANDYIGSRGQIFYNETVGDLRLSDGQTMGGIPISIGGTGGGTALTVKNHSIVLSTTTSSIDFVGDGVHTTHVGDNITVDITYGMFLDGGYPISIYGGISSIDGGSV